MSDNLVPENDLPVSSSNEVPESDLPSTSTSKAQSKTAGAIAGAAIGAPVSSGIAAKQTISAIADAIRKGSSAAPKGTVSVSAAPPVPTAAAAAAPELVGNEKWLSKLSGGQTLPGGQMAAEDLAKARDMARAIGPGGPLAGGQNIGGVLLGPKTPAELKAEAAAAREAQIVQEAEKRAAEYLAAKEAEAAAKAAKPTALQTAGKILTPTGVAGKVLNTVAPVLSLAGAGAGAVDAANRWQHGDYGRSIVSGLGAIGSAASMIPHPVTRAVGTGAALLAPAINYGIDTLIGREGYADGGDVGPYVGYPQIKNKPRDPNFVQQSGPFLGGLDAIIGMGPRSDVSLMTPQGQAYHEAYSKMEPVGIAANVLPFIGGPTKALGKSAVRELGPKAADMAENYLARIGGLQYAVPPDAFLPVKKSGAQLTREATYAHDLTPTHKFTEPEKISIQSLQGGVLVGVPGDRSLTGHSLLSVNGVPLSKAVELHGGPRYGQRKADLGEDAFWASQSGAASALQNKAINAAERAKGSPVFGIYTAMAPDSSNYALHHTEALMNQLDALNPNKAKLRAFDQMIRESHPEFLGMKHPEVMDQFSKNSELRKYIADRLNKSKIAAEYGMPSGEATIHAITDPALRNVATGNTGFSIGELNPGAKLRPELEHPTYDTQIPGKFKGQMIAQLPWEYYFPEAAAKIASNPKQAPHAWGTFKMGDFNQPVTQELVDKIAPIEEMVKSATADFKGFAEGGEVTETPTTSETNQTPIISQLIASAKELGHLR